MFLGACRAEKHVIYLGTSTGRLDIHGELTDTNIFTPTVLEPGRSYYYWGVGAARGSRVVPGRVWRFRVR